MGRIEGYWEIETAYGDTWSLQYPHGGLRQLAGIGIPGAQYATQKAPGQHGSSHLGYVLNDRIVQLALALRGRGGQDCLVYQRELYPQEHLNYTVNPLIIRRRLLDGSVRELHDVWYIDGQGRDSAQVDAPGAIEQSPLQVVARDPVWWDTVLKSYTVTTATGATGDEAVFDTPGGVVGPTWIFDAVDYLTFGLSSINITLNSGEITTLGTWPTFPNIVIVGPASDPEIENITTGQEITMNYDIPAGRTVTFDLRYGYKTVTDDLGTNLAGFVPTTDDLADFQLWHDPWAAGGANDIRLFCGNATNATSITLSWYDRFLAI